MLNSAKFLICTNVCKKQEKHENKPTPTGSFSVLLLGIRGYAFPPQRLA
jgi:hypothetical protein